MTLTRQTSSEEVLSLPHATTLFEILGINTCCGQARTLADAAALSRLSSEELIELLESPTAFPDGAAGRPPDTSDLGEVVRWIGDNLHRRARRSLVALIIRVRSLTPAHGRQRPELWTTRATLELLARDLIPHMSTEETYLFPYIRGMTENMQADKTLVVPLLGTIEFPLQAIKHDHAGDMEAIHALRQSTRDFTADDRSCEPLREFYRGLASFARELQEHIHLENDVLFPQAVELEKRVARR
ncbi:MAG TPA: hemerythrin domain-containing protein [Thermoanaerobaculia bacterium]|nr:hemerythrin domain-containing protein [Thermoanaerobaculia bacterium]